MANDMSYLYPTFPIVSGFLLVLCLYPVPLQWRAGNIATTSLAMWDCVGLLISIIDICVWRGNINNPHPVWGDIVCFYFIIAPTAIACCTLCIQYRLWTILRAKTVFITRKQKGRQMWAAYFMCFGIPLIQGVLHLPVQSYRYNLFEDMGPLAQVSSSWLEYPLFVIWAPVLCVIAGIFAILTVRLLVKRRKAFDEFLSSDSVKLNKDHFYRLLGLALFTTCVHLPLATWGIIEEAVFVKTTSAASWKELHPDFGLIEYCDRECFRSGSISVPILSVQWWSLPLSGLTFFLFFGTNESAKEPYQPLITDILKLFGIKYPKEKTRGVPRRTWLDILLRRPAQITNSHGIAVSHSTAIHFNPTHTKSTGASDSCMDIQPPNSISFGEAPPLTEAGKSMDNRRDTHSMPSSSAAVKLDFAVEPQSPLPITEVEEGGRVAPERDPELTEEVTF